MWRAKRNTAASLALRDGWTGCVSLEGESLGVLHEAISNWSPGGPGLQALGEKWAINKGLAGLKKFAEGLRL